MKIAVTQVTNPKYWAGFTKWNNLAYIGYTKGPAVLSQTIDNLYSMVNGDDNLVAVVDKYPTIYTDQPVYKWYLRGTSERNIPLVKATYGLSETEVSSSTTAKVGENFQPFYLYFAEKWFSAPSVIAGLRPEDYQVRIMEDPTQVGSYWRYKVQVYGSSPTSYMPVEELLAGVPYGSLYAPVEEDMSLRGSDIHFESMFELQNWITHIRKSVTIPSSIIAAGKNIPLAFKFQDDKGKIQEAWINKLEWEFYKQAKRDQARVILYGKNTVGLDGTTQIFGESGNPVKAGYGLYDQMAGSNLGFYNVFNLDGFTDFLMGISYNKLDESDRRFLVTTGEFGMYQFHKAVAAKMATYAWLRSDHNVQVVNGKVNVTEGQITKFDWINGITIEMMVDKMLDSPVTAGKISNPNGGYISSYIYNIWDFGSDKGEPNIAKVGIKGWEEFMAYRPGFRDPYSPGGLGSVPHPVADMQDAYQLSKMCITSVRIKNPLRTGRYMPSTYKALGY